MKPITTIKTAKKAWEILRKANLHHFLDAGTLAAIGTLSEINISISDIITDLLTNGVLTEFLATITDSPNYITPDNKTIPWDDIDIATAGEIISAFFTNFLTAFRMQTKS